MEKKNALIELIVTNQCNKRCEYCDLDFVSDYQLEENLMAFSDLLSKSQKDVWDLTINFFWWEPLLGFSLIEKFIAMNCDIQDISYSLGTNGLMLDEQKFSFLASHNVKIHFSIDTETFDHIFTKDFLANYPKLIINFILNPRTIKQSFPIFKQLVEAGFTKFNIIPVYFTIDWSVEQLKELKKFVEFTKMFKKLDIYFFSFYEDVTADAEFILDTNGKMYKDIHSHFWFLKQYSMVSDSLKDYIEDYTYVNHISEIWHIGEMLDTHDPLSLVHESSRIAETIGMKKTTTLLHKIIKDETL